MIVRDKNHSPQPIIALAPDKEMDWNRWWEQVHELPRLNVPIIRDFDAIPRTATMKVQRLQIEKELKSQSPNYLRKERSILVFLFFFLNWMR